MDWKQEHASFGDFIGAHPEITITTSEVSIPQEVREEFYRRFDDFRIAVVEASYPLLPGEIKILSENYTRIEKEVMEILGLESIILPKDLDSFLHNPKDGLIRAIYNRTFDLLKGKTTAESFEEQASEDLRTAAADLFRLGYEQWAALAMIKLLDPDESFLVDLDDEYQPFLRDLKDISFGRQAHHPTMRIPEFVIHSRKLNKYVAVKMVLVREIETFVVTIRPPVRPKKKTGDTSFALGSRAMILSFLSKADKIPVLADIYDGTLTSPDWMVEYMSNEELRDPNSLEEVKMHLDVLHPRLGTCLILLNENSEYGLETIPEGIQLVAAGFNQSKLQSVIDTISS